MAPYHGHMSYGGGYGGLGYDPLVAMMHMMPQHQGFPQWHLMNGMAAHMMHTMMRVGPGMGHQVMPYETHGSSQGQAQPGMGHQGHQGLNPRMAQQNKDSLAREWKLFIGQVPFTSTEHDLWPIFSPHGTILELVVLRVQGRSKGCAFLTYETKEMAETALTMVDGKICVPSDPKQRMLLVKFATPQPTGQ